MGKIKKPQQSTTINDLCSINQDIITEDIIVQQLRSRYESNLLYTRISDGVLIAMNNFTGGLQQDLGLEYVAEYKNTSNNHDTPLPPHIFQLVNGAYLHMRRTGIDQSIVLR
jgi:chitin synthase